MIINANGTEISILKRSDDFEKNYISLTDIARRKNPHEPKDVVKNWMRLRSTIDYLGLWEQLNNPDFKGVEFDTFRKESGRYGGTYAHSDIAFEFASWISPELTPQEINYKYASEADMLNMALFGKTAKQWRKETGITKGNMRDYASVEQLIILINLESMNADLIREGIPTGERLKKLRSIAYYQMQSLTRNKTIEHIKENLIEGN